MSSPNMRSLHPDALYRDSCRGSRFFLPLRTLSALSVLSGYLFLLVTFTYLKSYILTEENTYFGFDII